MEQKNKEQTIDSIVSELREAIDKSDLTNGKPEINRIISTLEKRVQLRKKADSGLFRLVSIFMVILGASLLFNFMQLDRTSAIEVKISNLEYRDSLFNIFMEPDSNKMFSYRIRNGKPITYKQLNIENDSLYQELTTTTTQKERYKSLQSYYASSLDATNANLKYSDSLFNIFMEPDSNYTFSYRSRNGKPVSYKQLSAQLDSLSKLNARYRVQLELVLKNYPIELKQNGNKYTISSPKIDSALILLPYYRDLLKYVKDEHKWEIQILDRNHNMP